MKFLNKACIQPSIVVPERWTSETHILHFLVWFVAEKYKLEYFLSI